jgi:hypothetical protein
MTTRPSNDTSNKVYEREVLPKVGLPALSEDVDYKVYEYNEPYESVENGEIVERRNYVRQTNEDFDFVMEADANGRYLKQRDNSS